MANNLKISLTATLDKQLSKTEINNKIKEIEGQFGKINLQIKLDDTILKKLTDLTNKLKEFGNVTTQSGKLVEDANKREAKSVTDLTQKYSKLISEVKKYNSDGKLKSSTSTYQDDKGNGRVINTNAKGDVTGYKDIENIQKFQKEQEKLRKSLIELGRSGKYSSDELRKIGQGLNTANTLQQVEKLKSSLNNIKMGNSFATDQDKVTQSLKRMYDQGTVNEKFFKNFNKVINATKNVGELNKVQQALKRVNDIAKNKSLQQSMLSDANKLLSYNTKNLDVQGISNTNKLINSIKNIIPTSKNASNQLKQLQSQLKGYSTNMEQASHHTLTFGSALKQALAGFSLWSLTASMVYAPIRALQDMTQRLIEVDTLMTDIKRVMNMPDFKFTELLQEAVDTSDSLSSKLTDVLKIMGDFGRMGFDESQLVDITKTAQVLQNISDLDATASVDTLTSAMLNFNISAQDSITIADKLNEVDNNFAIRRVA